MNNTKHSDKLNGLKAAFGGQMSISLDALRDYFRSTEPHIPDSTIKWRVHDLVNSGILSRSGHGMYQLGSTDTYLPELPSRVLKAGKFIKKEFPSINYCVWDSGLLNEFAQHVSSYHFILIDVERDVMESVYYRLRDEFSGVFLRPSEKLINEVLPDFRLPLIVRQLTTESPLSEYEHISTVTVEKLLVDIFCDPEFYYLIGSERREVFYNAYDKYTINESKLLRYASRKGQRERIQEYIIESQFNKQHSSKFR
jgi:hypothetical protein